MSEAARGPRIRRQRLSPTLTGYVARQFLTRIFGFLLALAGIIVLGNVIDLVDRFASRSETSLGLVLEMALLKLPFLSQEVMPFTILFAGMTTFWRLTRSHELVVARAAGVTPVILGDAIEGEAREVAKVQAGLARQVTRHGRPAAPPAVLLSAATCQPDR